MELIRALHAVDRTADALEAYAQTRKTLADELGIDLGLELQQLQQDILRDATRQLSPMSDAAPADPVPEQLPANVHGFTGRLGYLAKLDDILSTKD